MITYYNCFKLQGRQCEKCKPLFVGDPSNNGQCVPCIEYCNGHTPFCINDSMESFPVSKILIEFFCFTFSQTLRVLLKFFDFLI